MRSVQLEIKMTAVGDVPKPDNVERISVYVDGNDRLSVAAAGIEKLFEALRETGTMAEPVESTYGVTYGLY